MTELLAPAGSMEALKAAIYAGADAVYVGGNRFNARAYATNFDLEALKEAVQLCHLHGVRLFVTVNTIYKDHELPDLYDYLKALYFMQVDALIVQDEGLIHFIQRHFQDFEIHASTQCTVHHPDGLAHYEKMGVKRVVVARENSLDEIKTMIQKSPLEIEVFVHGALCVSYSGQCYMSQMIGGRSANRGQCAQPCRLPYQLIKDGQIISDRCNLLSCKDLCTIEKIDELVKAGIASFKIEGRMKRPAYVYAVTKAYRDALDHHLEQDPVPQLKQLFNRDFTSGYLFGEGNITSPVYAGNRGVLAGQVLRFQAAKQRLVIQSYIDLKQGDGIRIGFTDEGKVLNKLYIHGRLVNSVPANTIFETDYQSAVSQHVEIYRTTSTDLERKIALESQKLNRKIPVTMHLSGQIGQPVCLKMDDGCFQVSVYTNEVAVRAEKALDPQRLKTQLEKLGNTIYQTEKTVIEMAPDVYLSIRDINALRREAVEKLNQLRANRRVREKDVFLPFSYVQPAHQKMKKRYIRFHTLEQLRCALPMQSDEMFFFDKPEAFLQAKHICPDIGLVIPAIASEKTFQLCDQLLQAYPDLNIACQHVDAYERYQAHVKLLLPGFNLSHGEALESYPVPAVISLDLNDQEVTSLAQKGYQFVVQTYGHLDNMMTKHCPVSVLKYGYKQEKCHQCRQGSYALVDRANASFPLLFDQDCIVHILSEKPLMKNNQVSSAYLRFTLESPEEVTRILIKARN